MTTETVQEISRQKILKGLLEAVKQCQREYGGKSELATDSNPSVVNLLVQFEAVFQHGLKRGKVWGAINSLSEPLRQVTGSILSSIPESEPTFWPLIKDHLGNLEVQRFLTLRQVSTDLGRARSFIRSCLNEHSLERHVASFLADRHSIRQYYEDWALLLDDEKASTLPAMARGLAPIFFAVQIDHPMLDEGMAQPSSYPALKASRVKPRYDDALPIIAGEPEMLSSESGSDSKASKKRKKRKVKTVNLNSIEGDGSFDDQSLDDVITSPVLDSLPPDQESATSNPPSKGALTGTDFTSLPQDIPNIPERRRSHDMSLIERVASLNTSFKHSLSVTSQDPEGSPSKDDVGDTRDTLLERDLEPHFYENPGISPEVSFQYKKQTATNELLFSSVYSSEEQPHQQRRLDKPLLDTKTEDGVSSSEKLQHTFIHEAAFAKLPSSAGDYCIKEEFFEFSAASRDSQFADSGCATSTNHQGARVKQSNTVSIRSNSQLQTSSKARTSSDLLHIMLGSGEQLSVSEGAFDKLVLEEGLHTPPATPEPDNLTPSESSIRGESRVMAPLANGLKDLDQVIREKLSERFEEETFVFDAWGDRPCSTHESGTQEAWVDFNKGNGNLVDLRKESEVEDSQSLASSTTENDSLDILQPVGYDSTKFHDLVMTYDMESMKAASDTLAVLNHSNSIEPVFHVDKDMDSRISSFLQSDIKNSNLDSSTSYGSSLSVADLKEAILSTTKRKDYLEEANRTLQNALDEEKEYALMLKGEVDCAQEQLSELQEKSQEKILDLSRENNVLRNQLKKYVAAVQLLRRDNKQLSSETSDAISTLRGLKDDSDIVLPEEPRRHTSSESDSIFEEKLAQIAEMHGELLEFNEHLQRQLIHRESQVSKMREELISLRGPLPQDLETTSSSSPDERSTPTGKPLINIWIPSVFAKGKGSEAYHVYQVYLRIGDEEWNIYRRYSQFLKLHLKSSKQFACLADFSFPPKKILGKKDLKFVEGRRRRLQEYLRKLINLMLSANEALAEQPNKQNLVQIEPFFGEPYSEEEKRSGSMKSKKKKAPTFYTGL